MLGRPLTHNHSMGPALLILFLCPLVPRNVHAAEDAADPYDVLYDVIMTRWSDGKLYAKDESSPAIFTDSEFPFGDKTYKQFSAAIDAFAALPQAKIEAYSDVKRALLQRHLWKLFDVTSPHQWKEWRTEKQHVVSRNHQDRRTALQPKIASLIQRLALTRERILMLPDTLTATVNSGGFAKRHDPTDPFKPFLPGDLDALKASWVCMGTDEPVPVDLHVERVDWRSAFYSFIRLPKGHAQTLAYYDNAKSQQPFPVGTQVALVEQAFLISDKGEMVLSPLVATVSLRAYVNVDLSSRKAAPKVTQCIAEFVMQPRQLMQGKPVMRALGENDRRFEVHEKFICQDTRDPFETGSIPRRTRLNSCINCHNGAGHDSVLTSDGAGLGSLVATSPEAISTATSGEKRSHYTWKILQGFWQVKGDGDAAPQRPDQAQPRSGNTHAPSNDSVPELRRAAPRSDLQIAQASPNAETKTADPFDTLYDVIMTRYGPDGESYAENETSPALFDRSDFPFGDKTYKQFNEALDAFAALPQSKIEAYSGIKRALLQRHLWKVYDASHPIYYINRAGKPDVFYKRHSNRRTAVQPKIASLIHRLALTRAQILALPNTLTATVKSGGFAESHDPDELFKPFLPPDLDAEENSWICQGDAEDPISADVHSTKLKWRSTFLSFLRAPGGRLETLKCVEKFNRGEALPVGTQSALIEQAFLISDEGELVLSPLIVSISLRAYVGVKQNPESGREERRRTLRLGLRAKQCVAEFVIQPRQLMQGNAVMRALTPTDRRFEAGDASGIDGGEQFVHPRPRLKLCMSCHGGASRIGLKTTRPPLLKEVSPNAISKATSARKRDHKTWKALHKVWQVDFAKRDAQSPGRVDQPQPPLDNKGRLKDRRPAVSAVPRSAFDELYEVLMVRHARNGAREPRASNESASRARRALQRAHAAVREKR